MGSSSSTKMENVPGVVEQAQEQVQQQADSSSPPPSPSLPGVSQRQPQQQQQFMARRRSSQRVSMTPTMEAALPVSFKGNDFNDDDQIPVEAAACAVEQPEPDPASGNSTDAVLTVSTRVEYSAIPRGQTQDVFGLVTVQAAAAPEPDPSADPSAAEAERQPMDLICVLDVSGSMQGDKIRQLKDAMRFIVEQAAPKDRLSIVTFNSSADRAMRLRKMDAEGKDAATVATMRLTAGGGTSIAAGLGMGLSVMEQRRQRNKVSSILLLTDGQDGSTRGQLPALIRRAQQANCSVYAFGFGKDHDAALLSELAEQAQTPFTFVEDTDNIREAFAGAVGGLSSIVAQSVELTIDCRVPLKNVHTPFTTRRTSDTSTTIMIPDVFAGERRDVLVELAVPAAGTASFLGSMFGTVADVDGQTTLLESHLRYTDLRSGSVVQTVPVAMEALRVEEPQPEAEPDLEVSAQRERVEVAKALQEAATQSDQGQFGEAQRLLELADQRVKSKRTKTRMSDALCEELDDARFRMRSLSMWEQGGRAEVKDTMQMHSTQRCTNVSSSKSSKKMYLSSVQEGYINKSKSGW